MDKVSVVIATYNGEPHLIKQLESLRTQTRIPDEVLIFDDQSTDNTVGLINDYINNNGLNTWKVQINSERLGWKKNFIEGIKQASGTIIFLCDQDDVWYREKIEKMSEAILLNDHILLLACEYTVIYESGAIKAKVYQKNDRESTGLVSQYEFKNNFFMNPNPGCSYVLRGSFVKDVIGHWFSGAPHDEFFWLMATIQDGAYFYNAPLMDYIRYNGNTSEISYKDINMQLENLEYIGQMLEKLKIVAQEKKITGKSDRLDKAIIWCAKRKQLMKTRKVFKWLGMMPYWGYYNSFKNCLSDLWLVVFGKFIRIRKT